MGIRIYGSNKKLAKEDLRLACHIMLAHLLSQRMLKNIHIAIHQSYNLHLSKMPVHAFIFVRDLKYPPRKFTIWLDTKQGKRQQLISIAHELTHVKQHAIGEARYLKNGLVRWKDRHCQDTMSFFAPWEIDATGHEGALYDAYRQAIKPLRGRRGTARVRPSRRVP
jgi:hypothetical protein